MALEYQIHSLSLSALNTGAPSLRLSSLHVEVVRDLIVTVTKARVQSYYVEVVRTVTDAPVLTGLGRRMSLM